MTNAVLDLFKNQLNTELKHLSHVRSYNNLVSGKPDPGVAFPHWYFERIEGFDRSEADEIIVDGFDDEKIDAIHISDDSTTVRFFQFKNPASKNAGIDDAAVDGILTTIDLFLSVKKKKKYGLESIFEEIRSAIRSTYKLVFVTSGKGLAAKQRDRMESKLQQWNGPNRNAFSYEVVTLDSLLDLVYQESIPTVKSTIEWKVDTPPYQTKINEHKSLVCHIDAASLASAYSAHGEKLLQQNIRNTEGLNSTNRDIYVTATGADSENFYFYNNGVTIVCDSWDYDQPSWRISISRPQVVNGGQTIRQIAQAVTDGKLRDGVKVLLRVISIGGNKEFAGNVAVNLNNQTLVKSSFLKSNHPFFIQMQHSLLPMGWYFERKQGDWSNLSVVERNDLIAKISKEENIIQMQTGCQAYCAVHLQDMDLAKRNPKLIFLPKRSGGRFEDVATSDFTAERMISSFLILRTVELVGREIKQLRSLTANAKDLQLKKILKTQSVVSYDQVRPMISQAGLFISALVAYQIDVSNFSEPKIDSVRKIVGKIIVRAINMGAKRPGSWPSLLKSQTFYDEVKKGFKPFKVAK